MGFASGSTDGCVPVTSTRYSINAMKLKPARRGKAKNWGELRAWYYKEQVAGWVVEYEEGLTLVTVCGACHSRYRHSHLTDRCLLSYISLLANLYRPAGTAEALNLEVLTLT